MLQRVLFIHFRTLYSRMNIFTQCQDPIKGLPVWEEQDENYDYHQEVARSAFADMLHDHERNEKYFAALKKAIAKKHKEGQKAHVLDIGTGTGLLSMMAAKCGADTITACEAFKPMADCAIKIIADNGFESKIKLVKKRSTEMIVGVKGDMEHRANILVTEVFDTELIGEGALSTFKHAHQELLEKDSIVIPTSGTIWAEVIHSNDVQAWNRVRCIVDPKNGQPLLKPPHQTDICSGSTAVHDIQLSQLPRYASTQPLTSSQKLFSFDWSGRQPLIFNENSNRKCEVLASGTANAVFMWWDLMMDPENEIQLSCAPVWAHPDFKKVVNEDETLIEVADKIPWRDHWMQAIYYFPEDIPLNSGECVYLTGYHDEYSFWFQLTKDLPKKHISAPACNCFLHLAYSRTRIGQLNDQERNKKYIQVLRKNITPNTVCLSLSDGSLLSLAAAHLDAKRIIAFEPNYLSRRCLENFITTNKLESKVQVLQTIDELNNLTDKPNLIIGEPYFVNSILPWDSLRFWYLASSYAPGVPTIPSGACIRGVAVEFKDLHKIRAPLGICEGFDLSIFDKLVLTSSEISDNPVEAQPLWEYPATALTEPFNLISFDFSEKFDAIRQNDFSGEIPILANGSCNGIALWIDWHLDSETTISTGPKCKFQPGEKIFWDLNTRQGVYLMQTIQRVDKQHSLSWNLKHNFCSVQPFNFNFFIKSKAQCT